MNGRVLRELLCGGPSPEKVEVHNFVHYAQTKNKNGEYGLELSHSIVDGTDYLNFTKVKR